MLLQCKKSPLFVFPVLTLGDQSKRNNATISRVVGFIRIKCRYWSSCCYATSLMKIITPEAEGAKRKCYNEKIIVSNIHNTTRITKNTLYLYIHKTTTINNDGWYRKGKPRAHYASNLSIASPTAWALWGFWPVTNLKEARKNRNMIESKDWYLPSTLTQEFHLSADEYLPVMRMRNKR